MKQRFSSLDVRVIAHELSNSLVSLRLANVYDLSSRIFLLKFAKPEHREQLIVDSGFRAHLTSFSRATAAAPSPFVARLRKFLRTRRCTAVRQIGTDRIIEIQFSDGAYRLFLEFYAGGNIVLTDSELTTLGLLRSVSEGAEHEQYKLGSKYNLSLRQNYEGIPELTKERLKNGLQKAVDKQQAEAAKPGKKIKKKSGDALRRALATTMTEFPPVLIDHALHVTGADRLIEPEAVIGSDEELDKVLKALEEANRVVQEITSQPVAKGYILAKRKVPRQDETEGEANDEKNIMYEDFHPFKPAQLANHQSNIFLEHEGFNKAVDDFFSSIEGQKLESRLQEREDNAKRRIEQARQEQEKRITGLQQVQELNVRKAQAIEANVERVEEAVAAVNGLIAQGMDWVDIGRLIENEQSRRNPVAEMIKLPLKLHENTVTLLLSELADADDDEMDATDSEPSDSDDDDTQAPSKPVKAEEKRLTIDIDLAASAWSNARQYYDQRRTAATKQEKTAQASQKALKSTEQKVMADLKKGLKQEKEILRPVRKAFWFEKFIYFISSDGYLVLAGKDAQQNEMLYRRYLRKGDVYVHADMHGAATVIIKNNPSTPEAPIPPSTLSQAGNLSVCTSSAWDSKAVMSAWWVNADQVSKTAPTGEYLTTGGFMVRGKKNFLPPAQLLLGFAIVFQISEESKARHVKHRLQQKPEEHSVTPELMDAETIDPSTAGDGDDSASSDDEFPDAGPALRIEEDEDDDDDFPDAPLQSADFSADESPENPTGQTQDAYDDEDNEYRLGQLNPLQAGRAPNQDDEQHNTDEGDDEHDDEAHDESVDGEAADDDAAAITESNATADDTVALNENGDEEEAAEKPLTNRERKMKNRLDQGKPIHNETKVKQSKGQRGKKGKSKKIAQKYADQDEEDRELAMKLLGSKAGEERRQAEAKEKAEKTETAEEARARRRAQHQKAQREGLEAEEIRKLNLEEGVEALDEEESSQLTQLDALVGTPLPGDEILEAIPICAPWGALTRYKYKAKMQPGQQKKGKATREILGRWTKGSNDPRAIDHQAQDNERIWPREAELIKSFKEAEVVGVIPVKQVRVMMSGVADAAKGKGGRGGKSGRGGKGSKRK